MGLFKKKSVQSRPRFAEHCPVCDLELAPLRKERDEYKAWIDHLNTHVQTGDRSYYIDCRCGTRAESIDFNNARSCFILHAYEAHGIGYGFRDGSMETTQKLLGLRGM